MIGWTLIECLINLGVAQILSSEGGIDQLSVLQAAILHDTVEDTNTTFAEIEEAFGPKVK